MRICKQSTAYNLSVFMTDSSDHVTGKTGLTLTITASKDGAAFASISPTVTELASGWYSLALTTTHTNTVGDLAIHITGTGADAADLALVVRARVTDDLAYPATSGRSMVVDASGLVDANTVKLGPTGSGTAQTARDLGTSVLISSGSGTGQLDVTSGVIKANLAQILGTALTETAGLIAAGFKKFFNVATPTGTVNSLPDAVPDASGGLPVTGTRLTAIPTLPSALVGGRMDASVGAMASGVLTATAIAADAITAAKVADGAIDAATFAAGAINAAAIAADAITDAKVASDVTIASVTGAVGSVTGAVGSVAGNVGGNVTGSVGSIASGGISAASFAAGAIDAAAIATDAIGANELAASAVSEIQSGLSTLDAAGVRTAVGLASANLDTQLSTIAGYIDTEVAAIKAKTDNLPASPAAVSDIAALFTTAMAESYNADGSAPTPAQALFVIMQRLTEFAIVGTTLTAKKLDGTTTAFTLTFDDAAAPTSSTRST